MLRPLRPNKLLNRVINEGSEPCSRGLSPRTRKQGFEPFAFQVFAKRFCFFFFRISPSVLQSGSTTREGTVVQRDSTIGKKNVLTLRLMGKSVATWHRFQQKLCRKRLFRDFPRTQRFSAYA